MNEETNTLSNSISWIANEGGVTYSQAQVELEPDKVSFRLQKL